MLESRNLIGFKNKNFKYYIGTMIPQVWKFSKKFLKNGFKIQNDSVMNTFCIKWEINYEFFNLFAMHMLCHFFVEVVDELIRMKPSSDSLHLNFLE